MSLAKLGSRLQDPLHVLKGQEKRLLTLQEKVSKAMTQLAQQPINGGHPFLFALTAPKVHELRDKIGSRPFGTAATDGRRFYWHPDFLDKLDGFEISVVMMHEGYHVLFSHVPRGMARDQTIWNWAVDYVVNALIEEDHEQQKRKGTLWNGNLGKPLHLKDLLDYLDGKDTVPQDGSVIFADKSLRGRSPESIYEEIMKHYENSPRKCPQCGGVGGHKMKKGQKGQGQGQGQKGQGGQQGKQPGQGQGQGQKDPNHQHDPNGDPCDCGGDHDGDGQGDGQGGCPTCGGGMGSLDEHIQPDISREEAIQEAMKASDATGKMRGLTPAGVEGILQELQKPTLTWQDLIRHCFQRRKIDTGNKNDWKRFRRRGMAMIPEPMYIPKKYDHKPRWVAMLDTSGSMCDQDIAYEISQLQVLGNDTDGWVVPCDAQPYWNDAISIKNIGDLRRTKVTGRGGTVFNTFFEELPQRLGKDFDVVIVLTDGYFGDIPKNLKPPCDVVFVICNDQMPQVPFGRVAPLRNSRS